MEYQKITNLWDNASNQPSKFRTRNWVEINDESRGAYNHDDVKFKTTMLMLRCIHTYKWKNNNYWSWSRWCCKMSR